MMSFIVLVVLPSSAAISLLARPSWIIAIISFSLSKFFPFMHRFFVRCLLKYYFQRIAINNVKPMAGKRICLPGLMFYMERPAEGLFCPCTQGFQFLYCFPVTDKVIPATVGWILISGEKQKAVHGAEDTPPPLLFIAALYRV
jgi:hypothetical protein